MKARAVLDRAMNEADLLRTVVEMAKLYGWRVAHFRPAQDRRGRWNTAMQGDPGFPDIVATKGQKLLFIELKREGKHPTEMQMDWINALYYGVSHVTGAVDVHIWRPSDFSSGLIEQVLREGKP